MQNKSTPQTELVNMLEGLVPKNIDSPLLHAQWSGLFSLL